MACDICGKKGEELERLREIYKTDDIQEICPDSMKVVNVQLRKIQSAAQKIQFSWLKNFMAELRRKA